MKHSEWFEQFIKHQPRSFSGTLHVNYKLGGQVDCLRQDRMTLEDFERWKAPKNFTGTCTLMYRDGVVQYVERVDRVTPEIFYQRYKEVVPHEPAAVGSDALWPGK